MDVRRVTIKDKREFDVTVTATKSDEIPFPTVMLVQGAYIVAVPFPSAAALTKAMRDTAAEFLRSGRIRWARAVGVAGAEELRVIVTAFKDSETPFPTLMLVQGTSVIAVPFASGEVLSRSMRDCVVEFLREASGAIMVQP